MVLKDDTRRTLEVGMLLLDPATAFRRRPVVWCVRHVGPKKAAVISHFGTMAADAELKTTELPEGWSVIDNAELARRVANLRDVP